MGKRYFATGNVVEFINKKYIVIKINNNDTIDMIPFDYSNTSTTPCSDDNCKKYREKMRKRYEDYIYELNAYRKCNTEEEYDTLAKELWDGNDMLDCFSFDEYEECKPTNVEEEIKKQSMDGVKYLASTVKEYIVKNTFGDIF